MPTLDDVRRIVQKHWGFSSFRPLQEEAIQAVLSARDSLLVLPTGGGKSLCYQAPAVALGGTTIVVSPLISLMKDQVDSLQACGVNAIQLDSSLSSMEREAFKFDLLQGNVRLLFVSPERMASDDFCAFLRRVGVKTFAIDEAHCISHWGHDFRPEYRQMGRLRTLFPEASVHGFTATATQQVRTDICKQLGLRDPLVMVGNFDRPNLTYRILPRGDTYLQIEEILAKHKNEAGIIYCLRRADVDDTSAYLNAKGHRSMPYHAGMTPDQRKATQDAFSNEKCDLIVATVAFGMGIDRSNIRFVLHADMPKSIEHYQQETGRAGRDGLEAECVMLYSGESAVVWRKILTKSAQENDVDPSFLPNALKHVDDMDRYCRGATCRHKSLVAYFGQGYPKENCGACDQCLGDTEPIEDALTVAQKILSCVARVEQRFGVVHVISVLRGENIEKVRSLGHDKLTTFGLMREHTKTELRDWIYQLIAQGVLVQDGTEYPILKLNAESWKVFRKERPVRLVRPIKSDKVRKSEAEVDMWEGVDQGLFDELRGLRKMLATERSVPPYVIFSDATLRALAQVRPSTREKLRYIYGIGEMKLKDLGDQVLEVIVQYCKAKDVPMNLPVQAARPARTEKERPAKMSAARRKADEFFRQGMSIDDVCVELNRARSTVMQYLAEYIVREKVADVTPWVKAEVVEQVKAAAAREGGGLLKPIFVALGEKVPYDEIRLVLASMRA